VRLRNLMVVGSAFAILSVGAQAGGAQIAALPKQDSKGPKVHRPVLDRVPDMPGWTGTALKGTTGTAKCKRQADAQAFQG
jgi:hypothetical protein